MAPSLVLHIPLPPTTACHHTPLYHHCTTTIDPGAPDGSLARASLPPLPLADTDIRRMERFEKGGHFAAWEVPEVLVAEIAAFFTQDVDAATLCGSTARSRL